MKYSAIGLMSGSSLDGLDIALAEFSETNHHWSFQILKTGCYPFSSRWKLRLSSATGLPAEAYLLLHTEFGKYCGEQVRRFLKETNIRKKWAVIGSHGHTTFHAPQKGMTHQLGDGATIAAISGIPVVSDLRMLDVALGGQGAPIVPIGEKLLFSESNYFLNIGGISNISIHQKKQVTAFDVCPANRVLNLLSNKVGKTYDKDGAMAAKGIVDISLLEKLNRLRFYSEAPPKSLPNSFGTDIVFPLIEKSALSVPDALATYTEHIALQVLKSLIPFAHSKGGQLLITGGGALNKHLIRRIGYYLDSIGISVALPSREVIESKEALIMAFIGVLRLRQEPNVLSSVTGSAHNNSGGALWLP